MMLRRGAFGLSYRVLLELCEEDDSLESCPDRPTSHKREFFFCTIACFECLHVARLDDRSIGNPVHVLLLKVVYDDLIVILELIEESKDAVIFTIYPRVVRRMPEYKDVPFLSWLCRSWVSYDSLFQLFHKYILHRLEARSRVDTHIDEGDIFSDTRDDDTVLIGSEFEVS